MMKFTRVFAPLLILAVIGCANPADDKDEDLKVETKEWVVVDNNLQFYTNDSQNYQTGFSSTYTATDPQAVFQGFTAVVNKKSGAADWPFGFVFAGSNAANRYELLLTSSGYYAVDKYLSGNQTSKIGWTSTSYLSSGYDKENVVRVARVGTTFSIYFNDVFVNSFDDSTFSTHSFGPYAVVGDAEDENFPNAPVDVRFRFTAPEQIPSVAKAAATNYFDTREQAHRGVATH